jgi:eukaryotic-like serine/threonine-protein kinase
MLTVGVDLGTSRVRAAAVSEGTPTVVQFGDGSHFMPAAVAFEKDSVRVGRSAIARAAMNPQNAVLGIKRYLGRSASDSVVVRLAALSGSQLESGEGESLRFRIGKQLVEPEDVAAALLKQVWDTAAKATGAPPDAALLTVPYWFGPRQRHALKDAAQRAGIEVLQLMSEGTAIALSLASAELDQRRAAIVDIGAGGCTVSLLELGPERVVLLSSSGSREAGGDDIDHDIVRAMLKGLQAKYGEFPVFPAITEMIRQACEDMKRDLLAVETAQATIPYLPIGTGVSMQQIMLERRHFHAMMENTILRIREACEQALQPANLQPADLDAVYVTGGLSQVPVIRDSIASVLGQVTSRQLDIDGAVAIGAALQSAMMDGRVEPIPTIDIVTAASIPPPPPSNRQTIPPADVRSIFPSSRSSTRPPTQPPDIRDSSQPGRRPSSHPAGRRPSSHPAARKSSTFPAVDPSRSRRPPTIPPPDDVRISYRSPVSDVPVESLRVELATLLASVRGGALTEGARASKSNVVRSSPEVVDDDDAPPEAREEIAERLAQLWGQFHRAMQAVRQYAWDHPHTAGYFDRVLNLVQEAHGSWPRSVRFDMGTTSFTYDRTPVWKPERAPFDTVPYQLFVDGLRTLQLKPGLELWELRELAAVLLRDAGGLLVSDDDAVTALWDRKLPHVGYAAVDAYLDTDDPEFERDLDALEKEIGDLCNFDDVDGMSARLDAQRDVADEAVALTLTEQVRAALASEVEQSDDQWLARYAALFPEALRETALVGDEEVLLGGLEGFAGDVVASSQSQVVIDVLDSVVSAIASSLGEERARAFEGAACSAMFSSDRLMRIMQDLTRTGASVGTTRGLSHVLDVLPDDRFFENAAEVFWDAPEGLRAALVAYQLRFAQGREAALADVLVRGDPNLAISTLRGLAEIGTPEARSVLLRAFDNPHLEVKVSAVAFLPDAAAEKVRAEVARLLEDPSAEVRLRTLAVLSRLGSTAVGPVLVRRIQSADLSSLSAQEQKLLLDSLVKLSPRRGSQIAIEILDTTQMIPTQGPEETRAIAAEVLASVDSEAVLQALERAARKKWSNSTAVREAAQRSIDALRKSRKGSQ